MTKLTQSSLHLHESAICHLIDPALVAECRLLGACGCDTVPHLGRILLGCTSVWALFIYGIGSLVIEKFYRDYHATVPILLRGFVYVGWTYIWEFSTGFILRQYGACPWDYTERSYNLMGLITLEYFPAWYIASLMTEQFLIHNLLFLSLNPLDCHNRLHQKG
ncbi:transmembrane protein 229B-like [Penaeus monodon]|uniref:transmembrane protein 229B-like n=1 Tax=Penaeus monodon TaxID=6687 RepID=UPI0018A728BB|nr:transmembrane protein 229B-like [Penaeus monodon]